MSFQKKIWINIPDSNNLPEIPEGQNELAIFDADNMNRIEEGIANSYKEIRPITAGGTGAATVEDVLKNLGLSDAAKIATGSYVGTGTCGQNNPTVIECPDFKPTLVFVGQWYNFGIMMRGVSHAFESFANEAPPSVTFEDNSILFYNSKAYYQFNDASVTYYYAIIGE